VFWGPEIRPIRNKGTAKHVEACSLPQQFGVWGVSSYDFAEVLGRLFHPRQVRGE
jgi:hypothetical protein